ncbi:MAG: chromosome segregation protein SMC [Spirochaetes bacterium GWD1_27_9]|nr:MAG: chromosome segregation protein SMC [Spirochaetes bacterium GWB1_27_13]OHD20422.1 MAG: chromosome segregation protein SMC [Spirochaetes bacterium GWC1_27_15]OHD31981.1 MAG: chromosome segregation protein SMC [Spirochaetes bacterium GWD1_27_9]
MLNRFEVTNFKNFNEKFVFDLSQTKNYEFNSDCIKNGIVNKALIYGLNGCGKSNLGLAIFDIISHLTDKQKRSEYYDNYLNGQNDNKIAEFYFNFKFGDDIVEYSYSKKSSEELIFEKLTINGKLVVYYDRENDKEIFIDLEGAETLNRDLSQSKISAIKYINSNTKITNSIFLQFVNFVDKMLFFKSLEERIYIGYEIGTADILEDIIQKNNLKEFEIFLNESGIKCKLKTIEIDEKKRIVFDFGKKSINFINNASTGTRSLTLFYYWLQRLRDDSNKPYFVFIDEFDAFYHQNLAEIIVKELKKNDCQVILTTHDTSIMSNDLLRPDCYFLMDNIPKINPLYKFTDKELRFAHNLEKMYRAGAFDE